MKKYFTVLFYHRAAAGLGLFCLIGLFSPAQAFWWLFEDDNNNAPVSEARDTQHWYDKEGNTEFPELPTEFSQIAVLLPLTGTYMNAAGAVREGIIAEYYAHRAQNSSTPPDIHFYDTQNDKAVVAVYQRAVSEGAQLIIGPLTKPGIHTLLDSQTISVPTLSLNYVAANVPTPSYLFQFGLAPEDEVTQIAAIAAAQGHERTIMITENSAWGKRVANAFYQAWDEQGGKVVDEMVLSPNLRELAEPMQKLLEIQPNTKPAKNMEQLEKRFDDKEKVRYVEPEHYRRHDFDFIFLAVSTQLAQQIPAMLKFFYAADVPVYASASIYNGAPDPISGNDLNGVTFCDAPWVIDPYHRAPGPNYAANLLDNGTLKNNQRFFALGLDAYLLSANLAVVKPRSFSTPGATGTLQVNRIRQIIRTPQCAVFRNGAPRPLPSIAEIRKTTRQQQRHEDEYYRD